MKARPVVGCLLATLLGALPACRQTAAPPPVEQPPATQAAPLVTPPVRQAVIQLAAAAPHRAAALRQLIDAINRNAAEVAYINQLVALIQQNIAGQVRLLATVDDPEARLRITEILQFNEALSHFVVDVLALPPTRRQAMLAWGLDPANVALVGQAWSIDPEVRAQGARHLAQRPGPESERLLVRLIDDLDRSVALVAMDAAADLPPSDALVDALWKRAIAYPLRTYGFSDGFLAQTRTFAAPATPPRQVTVNIHGRSVLVVSTDPVYSAPQDGDFATDVLLAWKSPLVEARLNALFEALANGAGDSSGNRFRVLSPNYGGVAGYLMRLVDGYKPKAFVPCLMAMAAGAVSDSYTQQMNNQSYRYGSRIEAIALIVQFTGQSKEDYNLTRFRGWGNRWTIIGDEKEEEAAAKKLRAWWADHYKDYGAKTPKLPEPGTLRASFGQRGMSEDE